MDAAARDMATPEPADVGGAAVPAAAVISRAPWALPQAVSELG